MRPSLLPARHHGLAVLLSVALAMLFASLAAGQGCPPDQVCKLCPTDTTATPGQTINVPLFKTGPASSGGLWLWLDCQTTGGCWSPFHTHNGQYVQVVPDDAGQTQRVVRWDFDNEAKVIWDYTTESENPAPLWITQTLYDIVESGEYDGPEKEYQILDAGSVLQMLHNPGSEPVDCEHEVDISEPLVLSSGKSDQDLVMNMAGARLELTNSGDRPVQLLVLLKGGPTATDLKTAPGARELPAYPASGWGESFPSLDSFISPFGDPAPPPAPRGGRPFDEKLRVRLDPGQSWERVFSADQADVLVDIQNVSGGEARLDKSIHLLRRQVMAPGSQAASVCVLAGQMTDRLKVYGSGAVENMVATARAVDDLPQGVKISGMNIGFESISHVGMLAYVSEVRYIRVGNSIWCWGKLHWTGTLHRHYTTGTFLSADAQVMIPTTAVPGDVIMIWYKYTVMIGPNTFVDSCHVNITVVPPGAPGDLESSSYGGGPATLFQNRPNPFGPSTRIQFGLAEPGPWKIEVFSIDGRLVRTLGQGRSPAGLHEVEWDGTSDLGTPVAGGIYLYRLSTSGRPLVRRLLFLR